MYGGESSDLPLKINISGVIPAIFASALLLLPVTITNFGFGVRYVYESFIHVYSR